MKALRLLMGYILLAICCRSACGGEIALPAPTGPFGVGRIAYHWTDVSRPEPFSSQKGAHRELMVSIWYPVEVNGSAHTAPYLPNFATVERADSDIKAEFGAAYDSIKSGRLSTHTVENAAISPAYKRYPVLVFSHGFGELSWTYTVMLEDLVSHGYIVAAVEHPYDASCVVFPDGRVIAFAQEKWDAAVKKPNGAIAYQVEQIPLRAADMRFVIDQLIHYDKRPELGAPFAGRLDLDRIGAFGHSLGGVAAARACQIDGRIRACMNQDADLKGVPFIVYWHQLPVAQQLQQEQEDLKGASFSAYAHGATIKRPFLFFATDHSLYVSKHIPPPTDEQLTREKLTRTQYGALVHAYQRNQDDALAAMPAGSYRISAETPGFNHRSFMDTNLLAASNDPAAVERNLHNLQIVREFTRAFFDKYLKGEKDTLLDRTIDDDPESTLRLEHFAPAARPSQ